MRGQLADLSICLRPYGFLGLPGIEDDVLHGLCVSPEPGAFARFNVTCVQEVRSELYYRSGGWRSLLGMEGAAYHAIRPHLSFTGDKLTPVWVNEAGRATVAWHQGQDRRTLLVGLDVVEEIIRHRQGDPAQVVNSAVKSRFGFDFERPNYLFEEQLLPGYRSIPWADHLGFFLVEALSRASGVPLLEPLPGGSRGAVILTGDDDQTYLEKYGEQQGMIGGLPITYFLSTETRHTRDTLAGLASNVELGVHPDALASPESYNDTCAAEVEYVRALSGRPVRAVRNHGYLNDGYLGHLKAWEDNQLRLDLNYPGVDGTALNGSFLPSPVRRPDGTWSRHHSLLTLFGDGMVYALKMSERQAVGRIRRLAKQIAASNPGVVVFNLHPQNVAQTRGLHREVVALARRPAWGALGLEQYLDWLDTLEGLGIEALDGSYVLTSPKPVKDLVLRWPVRDGWRRTELDPWCHGMEVRP